MPKRLRISVLALCLLLLAGGMGTACAQQPELAHRRFAQRLVQAAERGEMGGKPVERFMQEEKIAFLEGGFSQLAALCRDSIATMEMTLVDGKRYALTFHRTDGPRVTLSYPADYQLIMGVTLMELEERLPDAIRSYSVEKRESHEAVDTGLLEQVGNSPVYLLKGSSYVLPELNSNRYYVRESDSSYGLLYSEDLPLETMANLLTGADLDVPLSITILLVKYGYRTETFTVPLRQWMAYCMAEGCTPYFGVISHEKERLVCEVVMHNEMLGYAHVAKLVLDPAILADRKGVINARMNSYVPLSNVKAIFNEY